MAEVHVQSNLQHDGVSYKAGDTAEIEGDALVRLTALGVVEPVETEEPTAPAEVTEVEETPVVEEEPVQESVVEPVETEEVSSKKKGKK